MNHLLLLDVRADPITPVPWGALILFLVVVTLLSVAFLAALVFVLIRFKRRKENEREALTATAPARFTHPSSQ